MLRYQGFAVPNYSCTLKCLAYETLRLVKYPGCPILAFILELIDNDYGPSACQQAFLQITDSVNIDAKESGVECWYKVGNR